MQRTVETKVRENDILRQREQPQVRALEAMEAPRGCVAAAGGSVSTSDGGDRQELSHLSSLHVPKNRLHCHILFDKVNMTLWPSGLRRWIQVPVRKGVGSNPTEVTPFCAPPRRPRERRDATSCGGVRGYSLKPSMVVFGSVWVFWVFFWFF